MEFEPLEEDIEYYDSKTDSNIQIVFVPGIGGWKTWKHQLKYFSNRYRTLCVRTDDRDYESSVKALKTVLNRKNLDNVVLIGSDLSNRVVQSFSDRKTVISTVMTNFSFEIPKVRRETFKLVSSTCGKPKLLKKLFLSENTNYRIARELSEELELMDYSDYCSYSGIESDTEIENGLVIQASDDRFSTLEDAIALRPDITVREVAGGSFCFYEKPEEFNKALAEFADRLESFIESKQIREKREKNRSLDEFETQKTFQEQLEIRE
ncbi:alpha/beta fold hydrolase [Candidatus Nanohalococcus occultus]|uniref:Alpha/beta hydrolase n=1 Tax=Candidatus Nanohalococcus occultus TaxID=2978047 RepID=A0ABY8CG20_9ARCH|nr:hypothetical protein SVXNc_0396 [Candidatus Nanohaloarchaeota archaeon SVXNc]